MDEKQPPIRYIKLGRGGRWAAQSISAGEIRFGHRNVPHELASRRDRQALIEFFLGQGESRGKAADFAREIMDFYTLGSDAIWVTFDAGYLWWARADPEVIWVGGGEEQGSRMRRTIGPWSNTDRNGKVLRKADLSTRLTKVAAFRQTICKIGAADYLLRKLDGIEEPLVASALELKALLIAKAAELIGALHEVDFETLIDIILAKAGWHRVSRLGGTLKDADLIVEQAVTDETALVQVKSKASQSVLDDYIARFDENGAWTRMIFACHTPKGRLDAGGRPDITVWDRERLAEDTVKNGLYDWLIQRAA